MNTGNRFNPFNIFVGSFIPNALMKYKEISSGAKLTWARLSQFAGKDGRCYPKQETLAEELGVSVGAIRRYLQELKDKQFIQKEHPKGQDRFKHKSVRYFFLWHECFDVTLEQSAPSKSEQSAPSKSEQSAPSKSEQSAPSKSELSKERESKKRESIKRESEEKSAPTSKTFKSKHTTRKENFSGNSKDHLPAEVLEDISADSPAPNILSNNKISETNPNIPDQSQIPGKSEINPTSEEDSTISQTTISNSSNNIGMRLVELFCKERKECFSDVPSPDAKMKQGWMITMNNIIKSGYKPDIIADVIKFIFNSEDPFWRGRIAVPGQLLGSMDTIAQQMAAKAQKDKKKAEGKKSREFLLK